MVPNEEPELPDLDRYRDTQILTTSQASRWLGISPKSVLQLGAMPLNLGSKEYRFTALALRAAIQGRGPA